VLFAALHYTSEARGKHVKRHPDKA
jgi:hypothetical protein